MQYQNNRLPALSRIFITKHVRLYVNVVNIMVIIHAGGAEVYQETGKQEYLIQLVLADWRFIYCPFQWKGRGLKRTKVPDYLNIHNDTIKSESPFSDICHVHNHSFCYATIERTASRPLKKLSTAYNTAITMRSSYKAYCYREHKIQ